VLEQELDEVGLAAAGRADEEVVRLGKDVLPLGTVEVNAFHALDVPVRHECDGAAGLLLPVVAELPEAREDLFRRNDGKLANELDKRLETRLPVLFEILHALGLPVALAKL